MTTTNTAINGTTNSTTTRRAAANWPAWTDNWRWEPVEPSNPAEAAAINRALALAADDDRDGDALDRLHAELLAEAARAADARVTAAPGGEGGPDDFPTPITPTRRQRRPVPTRTGLDDADIAAVQGGAVG
jgi:hypothetical protein